MTSGSTVRPQGHLQKWPGAGPEMWPYGPACGPAVGPLQKRPWDGPEMWPRVLRVDHSIRVLPQALKSLATSASTVGPQGHLLGLAGQSRQGNS